MAKQQQRRKARQAWFDEPEAAAIDKFRCQEGEGEILSIAEALRRLVQLGLAAASKSEKRKQAA